MKDRSELMRRRYEQFGAGDVEGATTEWAEDFVWQGPDSGSLPGGGEHRGRVAALGGLGQVVMAWDEFAMVPETFLEEGDTVVVVGHIDARKGERTATIPFAHVWNWHGAEAVGLLVITDSLYSAELLGLV